MTAGIHAVNLANPWLNMLAGTAFTAPAGSYIQVHTGDPGSAGTANASANTTRMALSWAVASAGTKAIQATLPSWTSWAAGSETITHCSVWTASSGGSFLYSFALVTPKNVVNGDTLNLTAHSFAIVPIAA